MTTIVTRNEENRKLFAARIQSRALAKKLAASAEPKIAVKASPEDDIKEVNSTALQEGLRKLLQLPLGIEGVNADSYNEEGTGSAGAEIYFTGGKDSTVNYGSKMVDLDTLILLGENLKELNRSVPGLEVELHRGDEGQFTLLVMADAD